MAYRAPGRRRSFSRRGPGPRRRPFWVRDGGSFSLSTAAQAVGIDMLWAARTGQTVSAETPVVADLAYKGRKMAPPRVPIETTLPVTDVTGCTVAAIHFRGALMPPVGQLTFNTNAQIGVTTDTTPQQSPFGILNQFSPSAFDFADRNVADWLYHESFHIGSRGNITPSNAVDPVEHFAALDVSFDTRNKRVLKEVGDTLWLSAAGGPGTYTLRCNWAVLLLKP